MKLTKEQKLHLIDLLEMNIKEKQTRPSLFMTKEMIDEAIAFDMALIEVLENKDLTKSKDGCQCKTGPVSFRNTHYPFRYCSKCGKAKDDE